jgi:hypothetical protein
LSKQTGYGEMYKVKQHLGDDYIVNNNHILTLHMPDHKVIFWRNLPTILRLFESFKKQPVFYEFTNTFSR